MLGFYPVGARPVGAGAAAAAPATPITRPQSDILTSGWTASTGIDLAAMINEPVRDDANFDTSPPCDGAQGPMITTLSQPLAAGSYDFRCAARWADAPTDMRVSLLDAANAVQGASAWTPITSDTFGNYTINVTSTGAATRMQIEAR